MQLTEGSCFFGCFLKQFLVDVYSTAEITRLTNQREEFLVLYILIYTTFLAAFLGYAPSIKCAQVHRILVKKSSIYGGCRLLKLMNLKFQSVCNFEKWPPSRSFFFQNRLVHKYNTCLSSLNMINQSQY